MLTFLDSIFNFTDALLAPLPSNLIDAIRGESPEMHPVTNAWIELSFAPVTIALFGLERYSSAETEEISDATEETQPDAAETELDAIAPPITSEVFARQLQPLHPSWLGMLRDVAGEFVIANASDAQPDDAIAPSPAAAPADESQPLYELKPVTDAIAYFLNNATGEVKCAYAGFSNKQRANAWGQWLLAIPQVRFELRTAKRLQGFKWELKIKGLTIGQIQRLAGEDLSKSPKIEPTAPSKFTFSEVPDFDKICPIWSAWLDGKCIGKITERLVLPGFRHSRQRPNDASGFATREAAAEALLASIKAEDASIQRHRRLVLGDPFVDAFGGFAG